MAVMVSLAEWRNRHDRGAGLCPGCFCGVGVRTVDREAWAFCSTCRMKWRARPLPEQVDEGAVVSSVNALLLAGLVEVEPL